ncbi:hypothetical protein BHM03_00043892 [Ensete ventricosum]|nr:hypothetical protein BHM03_00043892 [Ensete ventricosum]
MARPFAGVASHGQAAYKGVAGCGQLAGAIVAWHGRLQHGARRIGQLARGCCPWLGLPPIGAAVLAIGAVAPWQGDW